jgi:hypothetical protein
VVVNNFFLLEWKENTLNDDQQAELELAQEQLSLLNETVAKNDSLTNNKREFSRQFIVTTLQHWSWTSSRIFQCYSLTKISNWKTKQNNKKNQEILVYFKKILLILSNIFFLFSWKLLVVLRFLKNLIA